MIPFLKDVGVVQLGRSGAFIEVGSEVGTARLNLKQLQELQHFIDHHLIPLSVVAYHISSLILFSPLLSIPPLPLQHTQGRVDETDAPTDDTHIAPPSYSGGSALAKDADNSYLSSRWKLPEAMQVTHP